MAHVRAWLFRPAPEHEAEFALVYGGDGPWAELFRKAEGFVGIELLAPSEPGGWWMTLDRWENEAAFKTFQEIFADAYRTLDEALEGVAGEERFVGAFG